MSPLFRQREPSTRMTIQSRANFSRAPNLWHLSGFQLRELRDQCVSKPQESRPLALTGNGTRLKTPENPIPPLRDQAIEPVRNPTRQSPQKPRSHPPKPSQLAEHKPHGLRSRKQRLLRTTVVYNHVDGIQICRTHPVPRQNRPGKLALQGSESKPPPRITPQNELHSSVTEPANPVVQEDRILHFKTLPQAGCPTLVVAPFATTGWGF